jgi:tRNA 2-selenouridine synthase
LDAQGLPVIDLEGLAGHRSSVYGGVDLEQRSQKMFSMLLYHKLFDLKDSKYIFVEGEAHKVGDIHLPLFILKKINSDVKVRVRATMTTRIEHLKKEYLKTEDSVRQLHEATDVVSKYVGKKNSDMLHQFLDDSDYDGFTEWLLVHYVSIAIFFGWAGCKSHRHLKYPFNSIPIHSMIQSIDLIRWATPMPSRLIATISMSVVRN